MIVKYSFWIHLLHQQIMTTTSFIAMCYFSVVSKPWWKRFCSSCWPASVRHPYRVITKGTVSISSIKDYLTCWTLLKYLYSFGFMSRLRFGLFRGTQQTKFLLELKRRPIITWCQATASVIEWLYVISDFFQGINLARHLQTLSNVYLLNDLFSEDAKSIWIWLSAWQRWRSISRVENILHIRG